jgi:hypothetical protein
MTCPVGAIPRAPPRRLTRPSRAATPDAPGQGWLGLQTPSISRAAMPARRIRGPSAHQMGPSPSQTCVGVHVNRTPAATRSANIAKHYEIFFYREGKPSIRSTVARSLLSIAQGNGATLLAPDPISVPVKMRSISGIAAAHGSRACGSGLATVSKCAATRDNAQRRRLRGRARRPAMTMIAGSAFAIVVASRRVEAASMRLQWCYGCN